MKDGQFIESKLPISESTRKRNPEMFGLGAVESDGAKQTPLQTLERSVQVSKSSAKGLAIFITIIQFRKRLLDSHDNLAYAAKPLADAISTTLGIDDADPAIHWEYGQVITSGEEGCAVKIEARNL